MSTGKKNFNPLIMIISIIHESNTFVLRVIFMFPAEPVKPSEYSTLESILNLEDLVEDQVVQFDPLSMAFH